MPFTALRFHSMHLRKSQDCMPNELDLVVSDVERHYKKLLPCPTHAVQYGHASYTRDWSRVCRGCPYMPHAPRGMHSTHTCTLAHTPKHIPLSFTIIPALYDPSRPFTTLAATRRDNPCYKGITETQGPHPHTRGEHTC